MRKIAAVLLVLMPQAAFAVDWWHDPALGCGTLEGWRKSHRIADLPGCDGTLPKGAPPGEVLMHDVKVILRESERTLDGEHTDGVRESLGKVTELWKNAPDDQRVKWAARIYNEAIGLTSARVVVVNRLPDLRKNYETFKKDGSTAMRCVEAFDAAERVGVDLTIEVELTHGTRRALRENKAECAAAATPTAKP